jgi:hypothetical protein
MHDFGCNVAKIHILLGEIRSPDTNIISKAVSSALYFYLTSNKSSNIKNFGTGLALHINKSLNSGIK